METLASDLHMEFLSELGLSGLFIGICTFLIIGLFHPIVVKAEYYWGTRCWWIFLLLGLAGIVASIYVDNILYSSLLGVFAFSSFWTIKEVFEQEERVKKGWFPKNPKRKYNFYKTKIQLLDPKGTHFSLNPLHNSTECANFAPLSPKGYTGLVAQLVRATDS